MIEFRDDSAVCDKDFGGKKYGCDTIRQTSHAHASSIAQIYVDIRQATRIYRCGVLNQTLHICETVYRCDDIRKEMRMDAMTYVMHRHVKTLPEHILRLKRQLLAL